jgi:hypothetical protein
LAGIGASHEKFLLNAVNTSLVSPGTITPVIDDQLPGDRPGHIRAEILFDHAQREAAPNKKSIAPNHGR